MSAQWASDVLDWQKKIQREEVKDANIDGIEFCPCCDYEEIPNDPDLLSQRGSGSPRISTVTGTTRYLSNFTNFVNIYVQPTLFALHIWIRSSYSKFPGSTRHRHNVVTTSDDIVFLFLWCWFEHLQHLQVFIENCRSIGYNWCSSSGHSLSHGYPYVEPI